MARIGIGNEKQFGLLLDALSSDIGCAHFHYKLLRALQGSHDQYSEVFSSSPTFWFLTSQAHEDATLFRLGRVFDTQKRALSLVNWLLTIKSNLHLFDEPNFRKRLSGNAFVDSLAEASRKPDETELDRDIASVADDVVVKKFIGIRHKYLAHRDPNLLLVGADLSWEDIEYLLDLASRLFNKYTNFFAASVYSTTMAGQDDYKRVLDAIKDSIDSYKRAVQAEIKKQLGESWEEFSQ
jgi:hypothetical protein